MTYKEIAEKLLKIKAETGPESVVFGVGYTKWLRPFAQRLGISFGSPNFATDGGMAKCDMCYVRVEYGLQPACVHTCTTGALNFGEIDDQTKAKSEHTAEKIIRSSGILTK